MRDAAEAVKRFAGFELFVGNIPLSVSEKVREGCAGRGVIHLPYTSPQE